MDNKSCPISLQLVDANTIRLNTFFSGLIVLLFLFSHNSLVLYFLLFDFVTRIFLQKEYSPIFILSTRTQLFFHIQELKVDSAPKKLAAIFGLSFVLAIILANLFGLTMVVYTLSVALLACMFLEVAFSYCLGCEIYHLYKKIFV